MQVNSRKSVVFYYAMNFVQTRFSLLSHCLSCQPLCRISQYLLVDSQQLLPLNIGCLIDRDRKLVLF